MIEIIESEIGNRHIELYSEAINSAEIVDQIIAQVLGWC